jgi:AcrR family transcriptional regulator
MPTNPATTPALEPRKQPRQERSRRMQERIVEAAIRVLAEEGALGFTTTRVADAAGISVGSLYQYFPNKHALIMAIHRNAVQRGWEHVQAILNNSDQSTRQKLLRIARWFFAVESAEVAQMGAVFDDIDVFLRANRDDHQLDLEVQRRFGALLSTVSRQLRRPEEIQFAAQLVMTVLESVGKAIATRPLEQSERERWATVVATMLCEHLGIDDQ